MFGVVGGIVGVPHKASALDDLVNILSVAL